MARNKRVSLYISSLGIICTLLLLNGLVCPPPPNGEGEGEGEGETALTPCEEGPERQGFVLLFSLDGEEVLDSSFEIPINGTFRVLVADFAQPSPDPLPYDFTLNGAALTSGLAANAFFELTDVPGCQTVGFGVDLSG